MVRPNPYSMQITGIDTGDTRYPAQSSTPCPLVAIPNETSQPVCLADPAPGLRSWPESQNRAPPPGRASRRTGLSDRRSNSSTPPRSIAARGSPCLVERKTASFERNDVNAARSRCAIVFANATSVWRICSFNSALLAPLRAVANKSEIQNTRPGMKRIVPPVCHHASHGPRAPANPRQEKATVWQAIAGSLIWDQARSKYNRSIIQNSRWARENANTA
jgi:hypothetical protein